MMIPATLTTTGQTVYINKTIERRGYYVVYVPFTPEELLKRRNRSQLWHPARVVKKSKIVFKKGLTNEEVIAKAA